MVTSQSTLTNSQAILTTCHSTYTIGQSLCLCLCLCPAGLSMCLSMCLCLCLCLCMWQHNFSS
jgi:hypothetical protein